MAEFWTTEPGEFDSDPKRGFRFKIQFDGLVTGPIVWFAKKVTKPNFTLTETKHSFLTHNFYYPGRVEWQEITMTLVYPVTPDAVARTNQLILNSGYVIPATENDLQTISKGKAREAIDPLVISQIDNTGADLEIWTLKNAWIKSVKYGELSYESDDLVEIELGFRYDWAECKIVGDKTYFTTEAE